VSPLSSSCVVLENCIKSQSTRLLTYLLSLADLLVVAEAVLTVDC